MLRNHLVCCRRAINSTSWAMNGVSHAPAHWFDVKDIFLSAAALDFYWYHELVWLRSLSGLFHKYAHVRGNGFWTEARRERRAYPEVDL